MVGRAGARGLPSFLGTVGERAQTGGDQWRVGPQAAMKLAFREEESSGHLEKYA